MVTKFYIVVQTAWNIFQSDNYILTSHCMGCSEYVQNSDDAQLLDIIQMAETVTVVYMCNSRIYKLRS